MHGVTRYAGSIFLAVALAAAPGRADTPPPSARALPATISTRFDPARDGLPFGNSGDTASSGNCWGMSLLAIDNYVQRTTNPPARASAPRSPAPAVTWEPSAADPRTQATVGLAQATAARLDRAPVDDRVPFSDPTPIRAALDRIAASGVPEVLVMQGTRGAHAVVLYGYRGGALQVYDPNFPGEAIAWPWDPVGGLGKNPKADPTDPTDFYDALDAVTTAPFDAHRAGEDMARLREACSAQDPECVGRYPGFRAQLVREVDGSLSVTGQVTPPTEGGPLPSRVWVAVNGAPIAQVPVSRFGTFQARLPAGAVTGEESRVRVIGEVERPGLYPRFAGFADLDVRRPAPPPRPRRIPGRAPSTAPTQLGPAAGPWAGQPAPTPAPPSPPAPTRGLAGSLGGGQ